MLRAAAAGGWERRLEGLDARARALALRRCCCPWARRQRMCSTGMPS